MKIPDESTECLEKENLGPTESNTFEGFQFTSQQPYTQIDESNSN